MSTVTDKIRHLLVGGLFEDMDLRPFDKIKQSYT